MNMDAFISYSHSDSQSLDILHKHLSNLRRDHIISTWTDHEIPAGGVIDNQISSALGKSQLFLALLSPDYIASNYCYEKEFKAALKLHEEGKIIIIPVILEPCDWLNTPFSKFKALPKDGKPVSTFENRNTAFLDVIQNIRKLIEAVGQDYAEQQKPKASQVAFSKNYRIQKDFDSIQKLEFIEKTFHEVIEFLKRYLEEITQIDNIKSRVITESKNEFTCLLVNRNKINTETQLTVSTIKEKSMFGPYRANDMELRYSLSHKDRSSGEKGFSLSFDEYHLFWTTNSYSMSQKGELDLKKIADTIWNEWLESVGIL